MKISQVKKVYNYELLRRLKNDYLQGGEADWRVRRFLEDITDEGIYQREYLKNKPKLRITFLPFIFMVIVISIVGALKWIFTGSSSFDNKSTIIKKMIAWDKYCRFNII